jgi:hypothetical protein
MDNRRRPILPFRQVSLPPYVPYPARPGAASWSDTNTNYNSSRPRRPSTSLRRNQTVSEMPPAATTRRVLVPPALMLQQQPNWNSDDRPSYSTPVGVSPLLPPSRSNSDGVWSPFPFTHDYAPFVQFGFRGHHRTTAGAGTGELQLLSSDSPLSLNQSPLSEYQQQPAVAQGSDVLTSNSILEGPTATMSSSTEIPSNINNTVDCYEDDKDLTHQQLRISLGLADFGNQTAACHPLSPLPPNLSFG